MEILELPQERPPVNRRFDFQGLSDVLFESAELLEESRASEDAEFRAAALELAIRSLYTASAAIDRYVKKPAAPAAASRVMPPGAIVSGPWAVANP